MEQENFGPQYIIEKKQEEYAQDNVYFLRDNEGNLIARHCIYPVSNENVLNFFEDRDHNMKQYRDYPVFGGYIESFEKGKGIGMRMWEYCEEDFFHNQDSSYLRFVFDPDVENKWTTRHVNRLIQNLNTKGIPVSMLAQKEWAKKFMGILLFEK